jgi:hypothetical protein
MRIYRHRTYEYWAVPVVSNDRDFFGFNLECLFSLTFSAQKIFSLKLAFQGEEQSRLLCRSLGKSSIVVEWKEDYCFVDRTATATTLEVVQH